jgi:UDP-N-acetyl-D-mannosaminuronic acid dehydrogenase
MDSKICVLGLGYIGLPTASVFAIHGYWVIGVDVNSEVVVAINNGSPHIYEPGLDTMVKAATHSGHLVARSTPEPSDVFIIAVPTPIHPDKRADLSAVVAASESIVPYLREDNLVILESTVSPGTTREIIVPVLERSGLKAGAQFQVAHAPERVLPGQIMRELVQNDRILGGIDKRSAERARELYSKFVSGDIYLTDSTTAEMTKLVENTYRDVNIALANELARISDKLGINVWEVIELANKHPRVNVLQPGPGVGGHCISVDPWFIVECFPNEARLVKLGRDTNDHMPIYVRQSIMAMLTDILDPVVTVLGVAYKANVDDDRESPSYQIIHQLREAGCLVKVHDPYVLPSSSLEEALYGSDCIALLVDHQEYRELNPELLAQSMRRKNLFVARKFTALDRWISEGFNVKQLGNSMRANWPKEYPERFVAADASIK